MIVAFLLFGTRAFGYSSEDVQMVIESMAAQGKEPTFCMGDDIPLAALSQKPHMLFDYFKQRFAQVVLTIKCVIVCLQCHEIHDIFVGAYWGHLLLDDY